MDEYFMNRKIYSNFLYTTIVKYTIYLIDIHTGNVPSVLPMSLDSSRGLFFHLAEVI